MWSLSRVFLSLFLVLGVAGLLLVVYLQQQLPSVETLKDIRMQVPLRVYSADKLLMAEYGEQRRIPVTLEEVPQVLINAVLATEDRRFYQHPGVDLRGLLRASVNLLVSGGERSQGGSTITMQVARNFFLTREKSFIRKINEILLAFKIERELSKDEILTLYLNKVFFGKRAYGVAAAAEVYYGKKLNELTLAQYAMIAGLPQAPSAINPISNPEAAYGRRKHVLENMLEYGFISEKEFNEALDAPVATRYHGVDIAVWAPYVGDMVLKELLAYLGEEVYTSGYQVYTTVDSRLQKAANQALQQGLLNFSERYGFRGAEQKWQGNAQDKMVQEQWQTALSKMSSINDLKPAVVIKVSQNSAQLLLSDGQIAALAWDGMQWARRANQKAASDILKTGDVVRIRNVKDKWRLAQLPKIQGALVALNPNDGSLLALTGGFNYEISKFNRATQAQRQPGSSFKPFIYGAAIENGYTAATVINDAPVVIQDYSVGWWRPQNDTRQFYGPTRLREGLTKSRNLVSIRLLEMVGINKTVDFITRFGFSREQVPHSLSLALGSLVATPMQMTNAFAVFANGGFAVTPHYVKYIVDIEGEEIFKAEPKYACPDCAASEEGVRTFPENLAPQVISPDTAYIMTSIMQDVVAKGTARRALDLGRKDLAGKTGTSNEQRDTWFVGYNSDVVATVWSGYDQDSSSTGAYGANLALPIWMDFMKVALEGKPEHTLPKPANIETAKIDPQTGLLARPGQPSISEIFAPGTVPSQTASSVVDNPYVIETGEGEQVESLF